MAQVIVTIPDGEFCSDASLLGCRFEDCVSGMHWCKMFESVLGPLVSFKCDGELHRARRKCKRCLELIENQANIHGYKEVEEL